MSFTNQTSAPSPRELGKMYAEQHHDYNPFHLGTTQYIDFELGYHESMINTLLTQKQTIESMQ